MTAIHTLNDLEQATPAAIEACRQQVTVGLDLQRYLKWLHDNEVTTVVNTKLKRNKNRSLGIHPSAACKDDVCLLKLYNDCTGEVPPSRQFVLESQITWDIGTLLHCTLQEWFRQMYGDEQFRAEVPLKHEEYHIKSHTDGLFTFSTCRFILEIKSIKEGGNYGFERVQLKPMKDNVRQAHFYMYLSGAPFALLFYMCKNNSKWKEHAITFDAHLWDKMVQDTIWPVVVAAYHKGTTPEAKPGWHCKWCDYEYRCASAKSYKSRGEANAAKQARQWARSSW
jgi:hypothetical protein